MIERVQGQSNGDSDGYLIPGSLMHKLITSVVIAIVTIGGYMVAWGISDARHKATLNARLEYLEDLVELHDTYRARFDRNEQRVDALIEWRRDHRADHERRDR